MVNDACCYGYYEEYRNSTILFGFYKHCCGHADCITNYFAMVNYACCYGCYTRCYVVLHLLLWLLRVLQELLHTLLWLITRVAMVTTRVAMVITLFAMVITAIAMVTTHVAMALQVGADPDPALSGRAGADAVHPGTTRGPW